MAPLADRIARAFPGIGSIEPLREAGYGARSNVVETAGGIAVKSGRAPAAGDAYEREWQALPVLVTQLSTPIPSPRWRSLPGEVFQHGALAYPMLRSLPPLENGSEGLARDLGRLLAELHTLPMSVANEAGLADWDPHAHDLEARPVAMPVLAHHLSTDEYRHLDAWWDALAADPHFPASDRAICHHDLWHDNILVDEDGRLAAVLDWDHVDWSDPAHDLAPLLHFGEPFAGMAISAYQEAGGRYDREIAYRVERYWKTRALGGGAFSIEHESEAEVFDQIRKVREIFFGP